MSGALTAMRAGATMLGTSALLLVMPALASAATADRLGSLVYVGGAEEADDIAIGVAGSNRVLTVVDHSGGTVTPGAGCTSFHSGAACGHYASLEQVLIDLGAGDDRLAVVWPTDEPSPPRVRARGGPGHDYLAGGGGSVGDGSSVLFGDAGNDRLESGASRDSLYGGAGRDRIFGSAGRGRGILDGGDDDDALHARGRGQRLFGRDGDDVLVGQRSKGRSVLDGGPGEDRVDYGRSRRPVHVDLHFGRTTGARRRDRLSSVEHVVGSRGGDRLIGDERANTLWGGPGADAISGRSGADDLIGLAGDDRIFGGAGRDLLRGGSGKDWLFGGSGAGDRAFGESGDDILSGGADDGDLCDGGPGRDTLVLSCERTIP